MEAGKQNRKKTYIFGDESYIKYYLVWDELKRVMLIQEIYEIRKHYQYSQHTDDDEWSYYHTIQITTMDAIRSASVSFSDRDSDESIDKQLRENKDYSIYGSYIPIEGNNTGYEIPFEVYSFLNWRIKPNPDGMAVRDGE